MKKIYLLLAVFGTVTMQGQILPNQTPEKQPEGTDAIYTQEAGQLNKILLDSAFNFFIPRIKQTALSYSITTTNNPDSLRGYFVLDNTATWYYIDSASYAVALGGGGGGTTQLLSFTSPNLSISGGNTVDISAIQDGTGTDNQTLSLAGTTLSIEDGNSVDLSGLGGSGTDDQTLTLTGNTLSIEDGNSVDLSGYLDNTDNQDIEVFTLTGTILQIAIENGAGTYTQNLASLQDGTGTDDQTAAEVPVTAVGNLTSTDVQAALQELQTDIDGIGGGGTDDQTLSLVGNTLGIEDGNSVDLSGYLDNTDAQDLSLSGNTLSLTGDATSVDISGISVSWNNLTDIPAGFADNVDNVSSEGTGDGVTTSGLYNAVTEAIDFTVTGAADYSVDVSALTKLTEAEVDSYVANNGYLTAEVDGSTTNEIQDLSLSGNTLSLTGDATTVDLSNYLNTDDQTIDVFAFDGTNLTLSLESDGEATKSIDLSSLSTNTTYDFIQLNTAFDNTDFAIGEMGWDDTGSFRFGVLDNYSFAVGQDMYKTVHNTTASAIPAGTAVMMTGADGNSSVFTIAPMTYPAIGAEFLVGVTAVDIDAGGTGVAVQNGNVRGLDIDAEGWSAGDVLYLDEVSAGGLTTTPGDVLVAAVTSAGTNGSIYVRPDFYAGLSQAEADAVGAMVSGNTETLIDVTYQADNTIDFVVNNDLSLYDNTTSGFLTAEVDGSVTNEVNTGMAWTDATNTVSVTDANGTVSAIITGFQETLTGSETVFDGWDKDASNDLVDADFGTAGLMATDGAGTYSIVTDNSTNWNTAYGWGDHATAGYLTTEVDGSITNEIQDLSLTGNTLSLTDDATTVDLSGYLDNTDAQNLGVSGSNLTIDNGTGVAIVNTVESVTSSSTAASVNLGGAYNRIAQIDMTSAGSAVALSVSNPVAGGVYTFHFRNVTSTTVTFPGAFLDASGSTLDGGTGIPLSASDWYTCYYDGSNYHCK